MIHPFFNKQVTLKNHTSFNSINLESDLEYSINDIFSFSDKQFDFESQVNLQCGAHALNNLFGSTLFVFNNNLKLDINLPINLKLLCIYKYIDDIYYNYKIYIDAKYKNNKINKIYDYSTHFIDNNPVDNTDVNIKDFCTYSGMYDIKVLEIGLHLIGCSIPNINDIMLQYPTNVINILDTYRNNDKIVGFIINTPNHWICIRKEQTNYRIIDSFNIKNNDVYSLEHIKKRLPNNIKKIFPIIYNSNINKNILFNLFKEVELYNLYFEDKIKEFINYVSISDEIPDEIPDEIQQLQPNKQQHPKKQSPQQQSIQHQQQSEKRHSHQLRHSRQQQPTQQPEKRHFRRQRHSRRQRQSNQPQQQSNQPQQQATISNLLQLQSSPNQERSTSPKRDISRLRKRSTSRRRNISRSPSRRRNISRLSQRRRNISRLPSRRRKISRSLSPHRSKYNFSNIAQIIY